MKKIVVALAIVTGSGLAWAGCSQNTPAVVVRSLERSKRAAFICVRNPYAVVPGQELDACFTPGETPGLYNYAVPHVISLVTQTARGEVALIDVTAQTVVDVDRSVPGYNFLPVGALPSDIVSTPGGNASFVGIGDPVRPGIFALPTALLPLRSDSKPPTYGSWPACALPPGGAPTEILIVADNTKSASDPGGRRAHCDGSPALELDDGVTDLAPETQLFGRAKLAVLLPELAELDIIDAQDLLARPPGSFDPCPVEHRVFLTANPDLPPITPPITPVPEAGPRDAADDALDAGDGAVSTPDGGVDDDGGGADGGGSGVDAAPDGQGCPTPDANPWPPGSDQPHPYALALADDGRMFISDDSASVIHVVDVLDPCTAEEKAPLLPSSAADPNRPVVTAAIAVSPLTSYGKQFVYATDVKNNGSLMAFDVSTTSTNRRPLERHDRPYNPYDPPDRIALPAPVESLTFATHEISLAKPDPITGITPRGMPCDPTDADDPNRPPEDFVSAGAGPRRLRGTFAFLALANGDLSVVDIDDYDAQCRRPRDTTDSALGCTDMPPVPPIGYFPSASQEVSCNVVEPHRIRSANFFTNAEKAGRHAPAMLTFPVLYDKDGTALATDQSRPGAADLPKLLGPKFVPEEHDRASWPLMATVLSSEASPENGLYAIPGTNAQANWVAFDLRAPRAHISQNWYVTYEGTLPWFSSRRGRLQCAADKSAIECESGDNPSHLELYDSSVGFCSGGAQGADLAPPGASGDILEIIDDMPNADDPYWSTVVGICSRPQCDQVFGTIEAPRVLDGETPVGRDIVIEKSYQGKLSLRNTVAMTGGGIPVPISCCFPYPVAYTIRAGRQWIVTGQASGFAHHIIADPAHAANPMEQPCIRSCDPNFELRNGRLVARSTSEPVPTYDEMEHPTERPDGATLFRNAQMRFIVWDTEGTTCAMPPCSARVRDRFFSFQEVGGFVPMRFGLSSSSLVMPQSVRYVRGLQMLAIPDPVAQGLILFNLSRLVTAVSFY